MAWHPLYAARHPFYCSRSASVGGSPLASSFVAWNRSPYGVGICRRFKIQDKTTAILLGSWLFLYMFQGAVYYHLQICMIIILLGFLYAHPWRSVIAIIGASFWAGMSRLNWYPVPAILAITIYFLEVPFSQASQFWRYIAKPVLWGVIGLVTALLGQFFYVIISGNTNLQAFGSSLTSALLWYRWFPSATNSIGIIPAY